MEIYQEEQHSVDLVILGLMMPGMAGEEVFRRLRDIDPEAKVLLSSGSSADGKARTLLNRGAAGFLQKPFLLTALSDAVEGILSTTPSTAPRTLG